MEPQMNADERGCLKEQIQRSASICVHLRFVIPWVLLCGCSSNNPSTTRPSSVTDRQNAALDDPFGYSPDMKDADISGGKINEYDRNAMRKDLDHVLNP